MISFSERLLGVLTVVGWVSFSEVGDLLSIWSNSSPFGVDK